MEGSFGINKSTVSNNHLGALGMSLNFVMQNYNAQEPVKMEGKM